MPNMQTIYFTKQFTSGTLKGLSVICKQSYPTVEQCCKVIFKGKKGKDVLTNDRWIVTDCSFQNYQR